MRKRYYRKNTSYVPGSRPYRSNHGKTGVGDGDTSWVQEIVVGALEMFAAGAKAKDVAARFKISIETAHDLKNCNTIRRDRRGYLARKAKRQAEQVRP